MRFSSAIVLGIQISSVISLPTRVERSVGTVSSVHTRNVAHVAIAAPYKRNQAKEAGAAAGEAVAAEKPAKAGEANGEAAKVEAGKAANGTAEAGAGEAKAGEEEKLAGEKELAGVFGTAVALEGGDIKQDTLFTKSAIGAFEFEFQSAAADELTVTENKTPAAPPAGFVAIEPSSFQVALGVSKGAGLTLSKIDYVFDPANAALAAMDLTQAKVGKLCVDTGSFVIEETLGELEFEVEENEVTLNLNKAVTSEGEWGIFLPVAAAGAVAEGAAGAANGTAKVTPPAKGEAGKVEAGKGAGAEKAAKPAPAQGEAEKAAPAKEVAKPAQEAAKPAKEQVASPQVIAVPASGVAALIDSLRAGKQTVPGFQAPARR